MLATELTLKAYPIYAYIRYKHTACPSLERSGPPYKMVCLWHKVTHLHMHTLFLCTHQTVLSMNVHKQACMSTDGYKQLGLRTGYWAGICPIGNYGGLTSILIPISYLICPFNHVCSFLSV